MATPSFCFSDSWLFRTETSKNTKVYVKEEINVKLCCNGGLTTLLVMSHFKTSWSQTQSHVYLVFKGNDASLDFKDVSVKVTNNSCALTISGGQSVQLDLYGEIDPHTSQRNQDKEKLILILHKRKIGMHWKFLKKSDTNKCNGMPGNQGDFSKINDVSKLETEKMEVKTIKENVTISNGTILRNGILKGGNRPTVSSNCQEERGRVKKDLEAVKELRQQTYHLRTVKHDWYDTGDLKLVLTIYIAQLDPLGVTVVYEEKNLTITMKTCDQRFHEKHGTTEETSLLWTAALFDFVIPDKCSHRILSKTMEVHLHKKIPGKWKYLIDKPSMQQNTLNDKISLPSNWQKIDECAENGLEKSMETGITDIEIKKKEIPAPTKVSSESTCKLGLTGLNNLGNTCFMNSVLQALANTTELKNYLLEGMYEKEINTTNPLGMKGEMVKAVAGLFQQVWSGRQGSFSPAKFKSTVGLKEPRFTDFMQHDAQEFMSFLLDTIHEDVNRIVVKPYSEANDESDRPDHVVAEESWKLHRSRNDSFIVDLFHGMYKSKLDCPACGHCSVKFDPFLFLPVPLPKDKRSMAFHFYYADTSLKPCKILLGVASSGGTAMDVFRMVGSKMNVPANKLQMFEIYKHRIYKFFLPTSPLDEIHSNDVIFVQETKCADATGERGMYELIVMQRKTVPELTLYCSHCKNIPQSTRLKRCLNCMRVGYCNQECQRADWPIHRKSCTRKLELTGSPFFICIPKHEATYKNLCNVMLAGARRSVNVTFFQQNESQTESITSSEEYPFTVSRTDWNSVTNYSAQDCVDDQGDELLDLSDQKLLTLDWQTDIKQSMFVKVESTPIDYDTVALHQQKEDKANIQSCLNLFTEPEVLSSDEAWYCPNCKKHREATKRISIWQLPDVLILQLKRFSFKNLLWRDKIDTYIDFPVSGLDMSEFCADPAEKGSSHIYDLYAVVNHHGGIFGGHYTSYVRLPAEADTSQSEIDWRLCDDSHVRSLLNTNQVVSKAAYVVMYKKRSAPILTNVDAFPPQPTGEKRFQNEGKATDQSTRPTSSDGKTNRSDEKSGTRAPPVVEDEGEPDPPEDDAEFFYMAALYTGKDSSVEPGSVDEISGEPLIRYEDIFDENCNVRGDEALNQDRGVVTDVTVSPDDDDKAHQNSCSKVEDDVTNCPVTSSDTCALESSVVGGLPYTDMDIID